MHIFHDKNTFYQEGVYLRQPTTISKFNNQLVAQTDRRLIGTSIMPDVEVMKSLLCTHLYFEEEKTTRLQIF